MVELQVADFRELINRNVQRMFERLGCELLGKFDKGEIPFEDD